MTTEQPHPEQEHCNHECCCKVYLDCEWEKHRNHFIRCMQEKCPYDSRPHLISPLTNKYLDTAPVSTKNMLAEKKPSRAEKEHKRIMKGASVG